MNEELTMMELIGQATPVVKGVMAVLLLGSLCSWLIIIERSLFFHGLKRALRAFEMQFWSGVELGQLYRKGNAWAESGKPFVGSESLFRAGFKEFTRLRQSFATDPERAMEGAQRAMRVALSREEELLEQRLPFLASVGSVSPYIGLFGTVWGIMHSFRGLANVQQATIATVAPGISEALIATAMGLFAAIPAVLAYNRLANNADYLANKYRTFSEEFASILHRQAFLQQPAAAPVPTPASPPNAAAPNGAGARHGGPL